MVLSFVQKFVTVFSHVQKFVIVFDFGPEKKRRKSEKPEKQKGSRVQVGQGEEGVCVPLWPLHALSWALPALTNWHITCMTVNADEGVTRGLNMMGVR